ncbi:related to Carboxypeptidase Y precursor [Pseudozyma flocculosa]|uniref:Carboxypeptidase n=1 Tax=Pseudozyma flocculosa TaxID=84751 RepID=A0A5C3F8K6_9BASI|nr:related to Carboxypeptidase Y precursor [Pseudozyma flocculosa]
MKLKLSCARLVCLLAAASVGLTSVASAAQIPFSASREGGGIGATTLQHPHLPAHRLRVVTPPGSLCDDSVRSYSGYLDVDVDKLHQHQQQSSLPLSSYGNDASLNATRTARHPRGTTEHFYFWAFESRNDPKNDPVVLWLNGGPGCSSLFGLLNELGPCKVGDPKNNGGKPFAEPNPYSWNSNATVIFLDQPMGVGYSYVSWTDKTRKDDPPSRVLSTPAAARDVSAFLHLLAMHTDEGPFGGSASASFHIAGESYGGRYLPLIANQILEDNKEAAAHPERGLRPLPLASVLIGNGFTSPQDQYPAYVEYTCTNASGKADGPLLAKHKCDKMYSSIPTCLALVDKCNRSDDVGGPEGPYDNLACQTATTYCEGALAGPYDDLDVSPYNWQHAAEYKEDAWVAAFYNAKETQRALGVDRKGPGDNHDGIFVGCSDRVFEDFAKTGDGSRDSTWAVARILDQGVKVLAYSGKLDFICNYVGNRNWADKLQWHGEQAFQKAAMEPWYVGGQDKESTRAGDFKQAHGFTYATVEAAGHFVPHE